MSMIALPEWAQALLFCMPLLIIPGVYVCIGLFLMWRTEGRLK